MTFFNKISRNFLTKSLVLLCGVFMTANISAKLVFVTEENAVNTNNFIINADDSSSDFVDLEFGSALGVKLRYDILNNEFVLNRDLDIDGDIKLTNSTPTLFFNTDGNEFLRWNNSTKLQFGMNGNLVAELTRISADSASFRPKQFSTGATADNNPAFAFQQDTDTGMYLEGDNKVGLSTGGVGRLIVDANGKVGIGKTSPQANLHIGGDARIRLQQPASGSNAEAKYDLNVGGDGKFYLENKTNGTAPFAIDKNDNVGIGDTTPDAKLDVAGSFRLDGTFVDKDGDVGTNGQVLSSTGSGTDWITNSSNPIPAIFSSGFTMPPSSTKTLTISGENFTPTTTVSIPGFDGTINSTTINSSSELEINITSGTTETTYDIVISNGGVLNTEWAGNGVDLLTVATSTWVDLRAGGASFTDGNGAGNDIRYRSGMSMSRDANGMYFAGSNPWSSWVKFESLGWTRGTNKTLQWIFTGPTSSMMIGIGSTATNESATDQYRQAEVEAYFSSSTNMWGLYGNNGTVGSTGNQSNSASITAGGVYKIKFTNDGTAGSSVFTLYQLPSANQSDWDDETNVLKTFTVGGTLNPDEVNIMPFIIPRDGGTQRFIAVRVD